MRREFRFRTGQDTYTPFIESIRVFLAAQGVPEPVQPDIALALAEVLNNIIRHGYQNAAGREILIAAEVAGQAATLEIFDHGPEFNPLAARRRDLGILAEHGMGIHLVTQLMSSVAYTRLADQRNRLTLIRTF